MPFFRRLCLAALAWALGFSCMAQPTASPSSSPSPDPVAEIERIYRGGDAPGALRRLDAAIQADPHAAPMRFLKGVILAETGHPAEASQTYLQLTQDYPELPEPYNNLAVLYAADGRLDQAREALETALRNDPGYATARENLGDVYVQLALRAYERAGGARNPQLQRKMQLGRELLSVPAGHS